MPPSAEASLDDVARLLALMIRRSMDTQTEAILAFRQAGLSVPRIAELLGTTPDTVRVTRPKPSKDAKFAGRPREAK
jgi:hypothetical protein